ncbi:hypothetical protein ACHAW5_000212 [Stephanodiscus triporus]|uniref:Phosphodiester glycosidase domain-containing protein n=1 Tax=Stephanodiscus triporus TaxID=2934178 RepID=A0ABD3PB07_9STRA
MNSANNKDDGAPVTWLSMARMEIQRAHHRPKKNNNDDRLYDVLRAFGQGDDDAPGPSNLDPDSGYDYDSGSSSSSSSSAEVLRERISIELLDEVDPDQARMFGRRFYSVSVLLRGGGGGGGDDDGGGGGGGGGGGMMISTTTTTTTTTMTERLLRLALHRRIVQILSTTDPVLSRRKAPRVRALVDFIWSQSLIFGLRDDAADDDDDEDDDADVVRHPTLTRLVHEKDMTSSSSSCYVELSPGFRHAVIDGQTSDFGPVHINVLRIDVAAASEDEYGDVGDDGNGHPRPVVVRMKCVDARGTTTDLRDLAREHGAIAAISGGFFLYSEPDIEIPSNRTDPVGMLVSDGTVVGPPIFRRAAIVQMTGGDGGCRRRSSGGGRGDDGERRGGGGGGSASSIRIDRVGMSGVACSLFRTCASSSAIRERLGTFTIGKDGAKCVHRGSADVVVLGGDEIAFSIVGSAVVSSHLSPTNVRVPLAGFVLVVPRDALHDLDAIDAKIRNGATMDVSYELPPPYDGARNAMAGGPMFFSDDDDDDPDGNCHSMDLHSEDFRGSAPPVTFSQDETHDHNLLPRMGVGIARCGDTGNEQLVCVAVDGRNLDRALGLTLQGTSDLLRALGCTRAMNLDGGSSKRMVVWDPKSGRHRVVCLSTTEIKAGVAGDDRDGEETVEPSRPVYSAILFLPGER